MRARAPIGVLVAVTALTLVVQASPPAASALAELDEARERRAAIEERFNTSLGDLEGMEEAIHAGEEEIERLTAEDEVLRARLAEIEQSVALRTRLAFMRGDPSPVQLLITGQDVDQVAERHVMLESLSLRDRAATEEAAALRVGLEQNRRLREGRLAELEDLRADLAARVEQLEADLEQAQEDERYFELLAQRQREVSNGFMNGIYSCPLGDPVLFRDTWGAPRSGGRSHKGVDMMAPHGTPNHAVTNGTITRLNNGGLGGISLYMFGDDGNEYYYTHLQGYAAGISVGDRVTAGDIIAYTGDTGNARGGAPHTHWEVHPGGGSPVNPYPYAAAACGR